MLVAHKGAQTKYFLWFSFYCNQAGRQRKGQGLGWRHASSKLHRINVTSVSSVLETEAMMAKGWALTQLYIQMSQ